MGCGNVIIENTTENRFFRLSPAKELELQDIKLKYDEDTHVVTQGLWVNHNSDEPLNVITHEIDDYIIVITSPLIKNLSYSNGLITYERIQVEDDSGQQVEDDSG